MKCKSCSYFKYCQAKHWIVSWTKACPEYTRCDVYHEKSKSCNNCVYKNTECKTRKYDKPCKYWWSEICICGKLIKQTTPYYTRLNCSIQCLSFRTRIRKSAQTIKDRAEGQFCKICGQLVCKKPEICRKQIFPALVKYFEFDKSVIGTELVYKEYLRIKRKVAKAYDTGSTLTLMHHFNYTQYNPGNFYKLIKALGIETRTISEAGTKACLEGRLKPPIEHTRYKHGWHTTWNGKQVYYRSSYELWYAEELDKQKLDYDMEPFGIQYWDSASQRHRVAFPDFYIPSKNLLIEIKSPWTYDEQNIKDKFKAYRKAGYSCKLILWSWSEWLNS